MAPPLTIRTLFPASNYHLLDVARRNVDDSMLRTIAEADYGIEAEKYLTELRAIRDSGFVPPTIGSREVLHLTIFSEPEGNVRKPNGSTEQGHHMRAFACSVVLRAEFEGSGGAMAETAVAQCLASARALGDELNAALGSFLSWAVPFVDDANRWLYALGLLVAASRVPANRFTESALGEAAEWVLAEEDTSRGRLHGFERPPAPFSLQQGFWRPLASELVERTATIEKRAVRDDLELLGRFVLGVI